MGNTVVWKPASSAMFSAYYLMKLYEAAGLPPGVINFVAGDAAMISKVLLSHRDLAGVHFTGSTEVFNDMWKTIGALDVHLPLVPAHRRRNRRQGLHRRAPVGRRRRAGGRDRARRLRVPGTEVLGGEPRLRAADRCGTTVRDRAVAMIDEIKMGDVQDFRNFMGAVIDKRAFDKISDYVEHARGNAKIIAGGKADGSKGYFISPTLVETDDPGYRLLCEEIFGPVVTAYVYDDAKWAETLKVVDATSPYALTGAVFAQDRRAIVEATSALRHAAGNFYINDKPTGAVVGQQPFGGARGVGHERQGGVEAEPDALGQRADDQGDLQPAEGLSLSVHGRKRRRPASRTRGRCDREAEASRGSAVRRDDGAEMHATRTPANIAPRMAPPCANATCCGAEYSQ